MSWASDTFSGTSGHTIIGQSLTTGGGTWEAGLNSGSGIDIQYQSGGGAELTSESNTYYLVQCSNTPPSANYILTGSFTLNSTPSANDAFGLIARSTSFSNNSVGYWFNWRNASGQTGFFIAKGYSGALSSVVNPTLSTGVTYTITGTLNGSSLSMAVQRSSDNNWLTASGTWQSTQTTCCTATDSTYTSAGATGFWLAAESGNPEITEWSGSGASVSFTISPSSGNVSTTPTITATGANTSWVNGTTTFSVSGGVGASISGLSINNSTQVATFTLTVGTGTGALTISDSTDSAQATFTATNTTLIYANDSNWFYSPYNWYVDGSSYAITNTCGAYFKIGFTGTSAALNVNVAALMSAGATSGEYPYIRWSIDEAPYQETQLTSSSTSVQLASGLVSGTHQLFLCLVSTQWNLDKWNTPVSALEITSLAVDAGATSEAATGLATNRVLIYGDSITEGQLSTGNGPASPVNDDAQLDWAQYVSFALSAEFGQIGFGSQGWTVDGAGNVPPLFTPSNDTASAWDKYFSGQSRLVASALSPTPNYVLILQGKNDANNGSSAASIEASVEGFLPALRAAAGPLCKIALIVPFDGSEASTLDVAFTSYQASIPDANCKLINIGVQPGLTGVGSCNSQDGNHPNGRMQAQLGSEVAQAIQAAFSGTGPSVTTPVPGIIRANSYHFIG
jgi:lysophospholipase L1-like esterase